MGNGRCVKSDQAWTINGRPTVPTQDGRQLDPQTGDLWQLKRGPLGRVWAEHAGRVQKDVCNTVAPAPIPGAQSTQQTSSVQPPTSTDSARNLKGTNYRAQVNPNGSTTVVIPLTGEQLNSTSDLNIKASGRNSTGTFTESTNVGALNAFLECPAGSVHIKKTHDKEGQAVLEVTMAKDINSVELTVAGSDVPLTLEGKTGIKALLNKEIKKEKKAQDPDKSEQKEARKEEKRKQREAAPDKAKPEKPIAEPPSTSTATETLRPGTPGKAIPLDAMQSVEIKDSTGNIVASANKKSDGSFSIENKNDAAVELENLDGDLILKATKATGETFSVEVEGNQPFSVQAEQAPTIQISRQKNSETEQIITDAKQAKQNSLGLPPSTAAARIGELLGGFIKNAEVVEKQLNDNRSTLVERYATSSDAEKFVIAEQISKIDKALDNDLPKNLRRIRERNFNQADERSFYAEMTKGFEGLAKPLGTAAPGGSASPSPSPSPSTTTKSTNELITELEAIAEKFDTSDPLSADAANKEQLERIISEAKEIQKELGANLANVARKIASDPSNAELHKQLDALQDGIDKGLPALLIKIAHEKDTTRYADYKPKDDFAELLETGKERTPAPQAEKTPEQKLLEVREIINAKKASGSVPEALQQAGFEFKKLPSSTDVAAEIGNGKSIVLKQNGADLTAELVDTASLQPAATPTPPAPQAEKTPEQKLLEVREIINAKKASGSVPEALQQAGFEFKKLPSSTDVAAEIGNGKSIVLKQNGADLTAELVDTASLQPAATPTPPAPQAEKTPEQKLLEVREIINAKKASGSVPEALQQAGFEFKKLPSSTDVAAEIGNGKSIVLKQNGADLTAELVDTASLQPAATPTPPAPQAEKTPEQKLLEVREIINAKKASGSVPEALQQAGFEFKKLPSSTDVAAEIGNGKSIVLKQNGADLTAELVDTASLQPAATPTPPAPQAEKTPEQKLLEVREIINAKKASGSVPEALQQAGFEFKKLPSSTDVAAEIGNGKSIVLKQNGADLTAELVDTASLQPAATPTPPAPQAEKTPEQKLLEVREIINAKKASGSVPEALQQAGFEFKKLPSSTDVAAEIGNGKSIVLKQNGADLTAELVDTASLQPAATPTPPAPQAEKTPEQKLLEVREIINAKKASGSVPEALQQAGFEFKKLPSSTDVAAEIGNGKSIVLKQNGADLTAELVDTASLQPAATPTPPAPQAEKTPEQKLLEVREIINAKKASGSVPEALQQAGFEFKKLPSSTDVAAEIGNGKSIVLKQNGADLTAELVDTASLQPAATPTPPAPQAEKTPEQKLLEVREIINAKKASGSVPEALQQAGFEFKKLPSSTDVAAEIGNGKSIVLKQNGADLTAELVDTASLQPAATPTPPAPQAEKTPDEPAIENKNEVYVAGLYYQGKPQSSALRLLESSVIDTSGIEAPKANPTYPQWMATLTGLGDMKPVTQYKTWQQNKLDTEGALTDEIECLEVFAFLRVQKNGDQVTPQLLEVVARESAADPLEDAAIQAYKANLSKAEQRVLLTNEPASLPEIIRVNNLEYTKATVLDNGSVILFAKSDGAPPILLTAEEAQSKESQQSKIRWKTTTLENSTDLQGFQATTKPEVQFADNVRNALRVDYTNWKQPFADANKARDLIGSEFYQLRTTGKSSSEAGLEIIARFNGEQELLALLRGSSNQDERAAVLNALAGTVLWDHVQKWGQEYDKTILPWDQQNLQTLYTEFSKMSDPEKSLANFAWRARNNGETGTIANFYGRATMKSTAAAAAGGFFSKIGEQVSGTATDSLGALRDLIGAK